MGKIDLVDLGVAKIFLEDGEYKKEIFADGQVKITFITWKRMRNAIAQLKLGHKENRIDYIDNVNNTIFLK